MDKDQEYSKVQNKMKKMIYVKPRITCMHLDIEGGSLLAATVGSDKEWNPGSGPNIGIKDEGNGNLGDPDSEVSGAKGSNGSWENWE